MTRLVVSELQKPSHVKNSSSMSVTEIAGKISFREPYGIWLKLGIDSHCDLLHVYYICQIRKFS